MVLDEGSPPEAGSPGGLGANRGGFRGPATFAVVRAVAKVTFLEVVRDKVLYNILLFAALLMGASILASHLSFIRPERIILDFGVSAVNISCSAIAAFLGSSLLNREFERRTVFVALAHPITRTQFVLGKFGGIVAVLFANWILLTLSLFGVLWLASGLEFASVGQSISPAFCLALALILVESVLISAVALLFSTVSTTSIAFIMTVGIYLIGNNISQIRLLAAKSQSGLGAGLLQVISRLLPNLETFNLGAKVTYGLPVTPGYAFASVGYGLAFTAMVLAGASYLVRNKEA